MDVDRLKGTLMLRKVVEYHDLHRKPECAAPLVSKQTGKHQRWGTTQEPTFSNPLQAYPHL